MTTRDKFDSPPIKPVYPQSLNPSTVTGEDPEDRNKTIQNDEREALS